MYVYIFSAQFFFFFLFYHVHQHIFRIKGILWKNTWYQVTFEINTRYNIFLKTYTFKELVKRWTVALSTISPIVSETNNQISNKSFSGLIFQLPSFANLCVSTAFIYLLLVYLSLVWFGLVLWHIKHCRLFYAKSIFIHIKFSFKQFSLT